MVKSDLKTHPPPFLEGVQRISPSPQILHGDPQLGMHAHSHVNPTKEPFLKPLNVPHFLLFIDHL